MTAKRVVLTFVSGSFATGFELILRLKSLEATTPIDMQVVGQLPPAPAMTDVLGQWRTSYAQLARLHSRIVFKEAQVTNISYQDLGDELEQRFNAWLTSDDLGWQILRDCLQRNLSPTDTIEVIIETSDLQVRQLPWHTWSLFADHYANSEVSLSSAAYQQKAKSRGQRNKIKILAILGNSENIEQFCVNYRRLM
jgi:hypothetical protein